MRKCVLRLHPRTETPHCPPVYSQRMNSIQHIFPSEMMTATGLRTYLSRFRELSGRDIGSLTARGTCQNLPSKCRSSPFLLESILPFWRASPLHESRVLSTDHLGHFGN